VRTIALLPAASLGVPAQPEVAALLEQETLQKIRDFDPRDDGAPAVAALNLSTGRVFSHKCGAVFRKARSIKIPILLEMFQAERAV
jgi:hypothetical protein